MEREKKQNVKRLLKIRNRDQKIFPSDGPMNFLIMVFIGGVEHVVQ